ncbi:MAG: ATP-binding protein [Paludibacteraceae bacterium]|nr:ATP-binding protein [Paludibacteraceae bacterium]
MKRLIYQRLLQWKNDSRHKPLILLGARQVGKTYVLNQFGKAEFENYVYINCHNNDFTESLFRTFDIERILTDIERYTDRKIVAGKTLLVFDEIQEVFNGIASLKYFYENMPQLHVAVAGSLLGITLHEGESFPVGKVDMLKMYPMTFMEYLTACGKQGIVEALWQNDWRTVELEREYLTNRLREYYFTGGMPEAVNEFLTSGDTKKTRQVQLNIIEAYIRDMSKHTTVMTQRIHQIWESIPAQLAKENKKFIFGMLKKGARAADFELALQWLIDAGLIYKVERCKEPQMPLKFYADSSAFKIYLLDVGLLAAMAQTQPKDILLGNNVFSEFKGAFSENYVLEQLRPQDDTSTYYFSKDNSQLEIDFLVQCAGRIIPLEVKAEENVKSKSLRTFVQEQNPEMKGLRISMKQYIDQEWMENIPLVAVEAYIKNLTQPA